MGLDKNTADQKWRVFAFFRANSQPATGDAANITAKISQDGGTLTAVTDTNPTETEDGYYEFDLTASETNGDVLDLYPESSTSTIQVIGVPGRVFTGEIAGWAKNTSGQKWRVFAFDQTTNTPVTGDAANITGKISIDYGTRTAITDTNPTESEDGYYDFDLTAAEINGSRLDIYPESSTANVQVIGIPPTVFTNTTTSVTSPSAVSGSFKRIGLATFARAPNGDLFIATGVQAMKRWDGLLTAFVDAGVPAPSTGVTVASNTAGTITGTIYAVQRWLDSAGRVSNVSAISDAHTVSSSTKTITGATNATPIVITTSAAHGLIADDTIRIAGVLGNKGANGEWKVKAAPTTTTLSLKDADDNDSEGTGDYTTGGTVYIGASTIAYTSVDAPTDSRVVTRQILRTKDGDANVYYVDVETTDLTSTSFNSTNADSALTTEVALLDANGRDLNQSRHDEPPGWKRVVAHYKGRLWAAVDATHKFTCAVTNGSTTVTGIGSDFTSVMADWEFFPLGTNNTKRYAISSINTTTQVLTLSANYEGDTEVFITAAVRPAGDERRTMYFSEAALPNSWNQSWGITVADDGPESGEWTALMPYDSWLYLLFEQRMYRFSFRTNPEESGEVFPAEYRGCVNQRCWIVVDRAAYILDRKGVYAYYGNSLDDQMGVPIQPLFEDRVTGKWKLDWRNTEYWHAAHFEAEESIKWFVTLDGSKYPHHAICFHYRHRRWWIEEYPFPVVSSTIGSLDGRTVVYLGSSHRRVLVSGNGTLELVTSTDGTLRGTVTSTTPISITDSAASFSTTALAGAFVRIVSGTGAGQTRQIVSSTATALTVKDPWVTEPSTDSVYQIGGIAWTYRTGWLEWIQTESKEQRAWEVVFNPTSSASYMRSRLYGDDPTSTLSTVLTYGRTLSSDQNGGIALTAESGDAQIDTTWPSGFVRQQVDDFRGRGMDGRRHVQLLVDGTTNGERHTLRTVTVEGAT